eukprot:gene2229-33795_t
MRCALSPLLLVSLLLLGAPIDGAKSAQGQANGQGRGNTMKTPKDPKTLKTPKDPKTLKTPKEPKTLKSPKEPKSFKTSKGPMTVKTPKEPDSLKTPRERDTLKTPTERETVKTPKTPMEPFTIRGGAGFLVVADWAYHVLHKVYLNGTTEIMAGNYNISGYLDGSADAYTNNRCIRYLSTDNVVSTIAGTCTDDPSNLGSEDGQGSAAKFRSPQGIAVSQGAIPPIVLLIDADNHCIRRIFPDNSVGSIGACGAAGFADGNVAEARFNNPSDLALTPDGFVVADRANNCIRKVVGGAVSTLAGFCGPDNAGTFNGPTLAARFNAPAGVAAAPDGTVYVADTNNHCIRKTVYVVDTNNRCIRKIDPDGLVSSFAGLCTTPGASDATGDLARFDAPWGITLDSNGFLYVSDYGKSCVRRVDSMGTVTTIAGVGCSSGNPSQFAGDTNRLAGLGGLSFVDEELVLTRLTCLAPPAGPVTPRPPQTQPHSGTEPHSARMQSLFTLIIRVARTWGLPCPQPSAPIVTPHTG